MDKNRKTSNLINIIDYDEDGNILLGENGISTGFVKFDTTPTDIPEEQGAMFWDEDDNTVDVILNGYRMKIGEDVFYPAKNQSGSTILKGTNVKFAGTVGSSGRLLILPFLADGTDPSYVYMGVTAEDIADGEDGKVLWFGRLRGLNTNAFNEGDVLYASTTSAGGFQTAIPTGTNNVVQVSAVIKKSTTQGVIFIRPQIEPFAKIPTLQEVLTEGSTATITEEFSIERDGVTFGYGYADDELEDAPALYMRVDDVLIYFDVINGGFKVKSIINGNYSISEISSFSYFNGGIFQRISSNFPDATSDTDLKIPINEGEVTIASREWVSAMIINSATFTVELIDELTVDVYAPFDLKINDFEVIVGSGTITIEVNDSAYTLETLINQGDKITVTTTTASVVNLEVSYE
jgi:hypothetical protein